MEYRREIDGLRALAVLPVILFHAGFETFSGGFVGVDVFFVISGYLITTIILAELEQGKFSIINFYERRARRILPALFLVMLVCIPFAWFWLLPSDMKDFSQSLVAVSVFASNILFWRESGYFDTAAELKPLLHTWSLGVEEQYYVLFPLFLMLFWKLGKRWMFVTLGLVFVLSLAVAQWAAYAKPVAAFYLLPTRGWELLTGAFIAFYFSQANPKDFGKFLSEFGGWLGVALILYAVFAYSKTTPFPGLYALVPTIGTLLIILFATKQTTVGKFLGNKVFVGIGLVSYSAYLWHQPLFAFARYRSNSELSNISLLVLLFCTFILAYVSWKFVEAPFRNRSVIVKLKLLVFGAFFTTLFVTMGVYGSFKNGLEERFTIDRLKVLNTFNGDKREFLNCFVDISNNTSEARLDDFCVIGDKGKEPTFIVFGDSHAVSLANGFDAAAKEIGISGLLIATSSCPPLLNVDPKRFDRTFSLCKTMRSIVFDLIKDGRLDKVFLVGRWSYYVLNGDTDKTKMELVSASDRRFISDLELLSYGLSGSVTKIRKSGSKPYIVLQVPSQKTHPKLVFRTEINEDAINKTSIPYEDYINSRSVLHKTLENSFDYDTLLDLSEVFCDPTICRIGDIGGSFYIDTSHLSDYGSTHLKARLIKALRN
jgi:peptidoglycan/LPS O-acetylase OafA/YrhL